MSAKSLQEMSLAELWELFPIELEPYNPLWRSWAAEEIDALHTLLHDLNPANHHVGSTAIGTIQAKPIIDILVELTPPINNYDLVKRLQDNGYICMADSEHRLSFNKGYTPRGYAEKVFHVHIREKGDNAEIGFRDYLINHPELAKEYESLKLSLLPRYRNDRDGYTSAKTDFINRITDKAIMERKK